MIHTKKRYRYIKETGDYLEDSAAYCLGFEWLDSFGIKRRVIYVSSTDNLITQTTTATSIYQLLDPKDNKWKATVENTNTATMDTYINMTTGLPEKEPFIYVDQTIDGEVVQIAQLKSNLVPEFHFLFNLQLQLFDKIMESIQKNNFEATGFN